MRCSPKSVGISFSSPRTSAVCGFGNSDGPVMTECTECKLIQPRGKKMGGCCSRTVDSGQYAFCINAPAERNLT